jgi:diaminopimelate decarboxylase
MVPRLKVYYALKSNSHPLIASTLVEAGLGLDVSSGLELQQALKHDAKDIIFSGPGKRPDELQLAVNNADCVTVLIDSFGELERLEKIALESGKQVRAGVRLTTDEVGIWRKFGVPLDQLARFLEKSQRCRHVSVCGLQFHLSWNLNPQAQVMFIARLGAELRSMEPRLRQSLQFLDIGGGFWPAQGEWLQPVATPIGMLHAALSEDTTSGAIHYKRDASSISEFADHIAQALRVQLPDDMDLTIYVEPGRWLCNEAMHILLTVVDRKSSDVVITDAGTNAVGWDRFESDYFPVINLSKPGLHEHECLIAGSLCTPHDLWGYNYFGNDIAEGDVLLVPNQGAYTYSLRQEFIKPLPKSVELPSNFKDIACQNLKKDEIQQ